MKDFIHNPIVIISSQDQGVSVCVNGRWHHNVNTFRLTRLFELLDSCWMRPYVYQKDNQALWKARQLYYEAHKLLRRLRWIMNDKWPGYDQEKLKRVRAKAYKRYNKRFIRYIQVQEEESRKKWLEE